MRESPNMNMAGTFALPWPETELNTMKKTSNEHKNNLNLAMNIVFVYVSVYN